MRFGTWTVRSLYRAGSLKTVTRELGTYKLDLVGVQEVRWEKEGTESAEDIRFSMEQGMKMVISWGQVFSYIRESYQQLGE
jgi:exonuclease III